MSNNLSVDGNLTVGGTVNQTGTGTFAAATYSGTLTASGDFSLVGNLLSNSGTSTSAAGAVTLNKKAGIITTETLTTISQAVYTLTITNSTATVGDLVFAEVTNGTNTTGIPVVTSAAAGAGTVTVKVANASTTTTPFGGTLKVQYLVVKA